MLPFSPPPPSPVSTVAALSSRIIRAPSTPAPLTMNAPYRRLLFTVLDYPEV